MTLCAASAVRAREILIPDPSYLERHARLDLITKDRSDALVEVLHNTHGQLRLDTSAADQVIERVGEGDADSACVCG